MRAPSRKRPIAGLRPPRRAAKFGLSRYWEATQEPLYCLLFLLPFVATYEFCALMYRSDHGDDRLVAHNLLHTFFGWFGASARWLPGLTLLLTLLIWHMLRRGRWRVHLVYLPMMLAESFVLTLPLFVLGRTMMQAAAPEVDPIGQKVLMRLGAGIFEELVFRLYLISGLVLLFRDAFRRPQWLAISLAVTVSSLAFAYCHFIPIGQEPFSRSAFIRLAIAGAYLSLVFVGRGLGVATACHVAYNLTLVFWR